MDAVQEFMETFGSGVKEPGFHWLPGMLLETAVLLVEVCYISILALHHFIGGCLLSYGLVYERPEIFVQGMIVEFVDDLHDSALMLFKFWPFNEPDPKLLFLMLPHHAFGLLMVPTSLVMGWYKNKDCQEIGAALLMAGAVSCFILVLNRSCDRRKPEEAWMDAFFFVANWSFFSWCRFYIFPTRLHNWMNTEFVNQSFGHKAITVAAVCLITLFNVLVWIDAGGKTIQSIKIALNGGDKTNLGKKTE